MIEEEYITIYDVMKHIEKEYSALGKRLWELQRMLNKARKDRERAEE